jgi:hypothetical protein
MPYPLSPADQARLTALQSARDQLIMGKAIAEVEYNGERRSFAKADMARLDREIDRLTCSYGTVRIRL